MNAPATSSDPKSSARRYRVVQWTSGNVGRRSIHAVARSPLLELVGCYAWSPDKTGVDAGELAGCGPLGVAASADVDALLSLDADCVIYNPLWPDVDELVRILASGANVVTTAGFITGRALSDGGQSRVEAACQLGGTSIFGSGMNPGFANLLGLVSAGICDRVDSISVMESVDSTGYGSAETEQSVGYCRPVDDPELPGMVESGTAVFGDAVAMMADALSVELDSIACESAFAHATESMDLGYMTIDAGCVAGIEAHWLGRSGDRTVIDLGVRWRKGHNLEPNWPVEHGYLVRVEGQPRVKTKLEIRPPHGFEARSAEDYMVLGMIMTSLPAVQAIPLVCDAAPGIRTYADLPLVTARGFVSLDPETPPR